MSRRPVQKPIHYVRATYNQNTAPNKPLEQLIRSAMSKLGNMAQTEIAMGTLGIVGIRHRDTTLTNPLCLAIGAGVPGEKMTTMGLKVTAAADLDQATQAPANRAFKLSEAFVLIDQNDVLLVTEGSFRVPTIASYLRELISKATLRSGDVAFELRKVTNQNKKKVLEDEGIKELRLNTTMYRATQELDGQTNGTATVSSRLKSFVGTLKDLFAEDVSDTQRALLAQHWGEVQVSTVIKADGGSRAEAIVLDAMRSVGEDVLDEEDDSIDVTVITKKGTAIRLGEVNPTKRVRLLRRDGANDLINTEVYKELNDYRDELVMQKLWQK
ncbi:hypothetical protein ACNFIA_03060 [Pseudomonas sp. NY15437]|uniref:hypothetical protein n=1 Tax=Pseudomonas sp. NY15437 TaxID=3400360 RepID=UPI003A88EE3A